MLRATWQYEVTIIQTRENKRANKGLSCLSGKKMPYRTDVPDWYVCSFASVCVLWHAEIWIQGNTNVFQRGNKWDISISDANDRRQRSVGRHSDLEVLSLLWFLCRLIEVCLWSSRTWHLQCNFLKNFYRLVNFIWYTDLVELTVICEGMVIDISVFIICQRAAECREWKAPDLGQNPEEHQNGEWFGENVDRLQWLSVFCLRDRI